MTQVSFKQMIKDGTVKRADAMKVRYADLYVEVGFNLRDETPELEASIEELAEFILGGGQVPPLEVRVRDEGGVYIVDGHRRHRAFAKAIARGAPIDWIEVRAFVGNNIARSMRVLTSAKSEHLSALETARGYQRLISFGVTPEEIAKGVVKSGNHVRSLLKLLNEGDSDVHNAVKAGTVSATVASKLVREHGDKAGAVLAQAAAKAKGAGKTKVTPAAITGRPVPQWAVSRMLDSLQGLRAVIPEDERKRLTSPDARADEMVSVPVPVLACLLEAYAAAKPAAVTP